MMIILNVSPEVTCFASRWTDQMVHANDISFYYRLPADNRDLFPYGREVQSDDQYLYFFK